MAQTKNVTALSQKEREILTLISQGLTSREIAVKIFLSPYTVNTHRRNILRKTGAKNILAVVALAIQHKTIASDIAA
jgi:DNA-binding CsgD family transcriptional regulator